MRRMSIIILLSLSIGIPVVYGQEESTTDRIKEKYEIGTETIGGIIATVNDKQITTKELFERLYNLNGQQVLNQMISELLVQEKAAKQQIEVSLDEITIEIDKFKKQFGDEKSLSNQLSVQGMTVEDLKSQIELQLLTKKLLVKDKNLQVTELEIKEYFDKNKDKMATPEQIRVSHILVGTEQEAKDLLIALQARADFKLLAKAKSMDNLNKEKGGEIGFFSKGNLVPEFEQVAFGLKKAGDISDIVKTQFGYHVIRLEERKPSQSAEFTQQIQDKIEELLLQQKLSQEIPNWLQELHSKAEIKLWDLR